MKPSITFYPFPVFANNGTRIQPDAAKYSEGYLPSEVFPAEHENWLMNASSTAITQMEGILKSVADELNNVVIAGGETPSESSGDTSQVLNAIEYIRDKPIGILSQLTTTVKSTLVSAINEINANLKNVIPTGVISAFYGTTAPEGWLICDGSVFDSTQYPELYTLLGNNKLPDFRQVTLQGVGQNGGSDNPTFTGTDDILELGEIKENQFQNHIHSISMTINEAGYTVTRSGTGLNGGGYTNNPTSGRHGNTTHGNIVGVNYIIKY